MQYKNTFRLFPNERFMDLSLYQYGMEQCHANYSYGPVSRNHYLFHYVLSGKGTHSATGSDGLPHIYELEPGSGFMIHPGQVCTYSADSKQPWRYCWIEFDGMKAQNIVAATGLTIDHPIYHPRSSKLNETMVHEMMSIIYNDDQTSLNLVAHLYLFLDTLTKASSNQTTVPAGNIKNIYIREVTAFVEENYHHTNLTIKDMADFCGLNQNYLGKIFKDALNQTPQQFLIYYRMNKAAELLRHTILPISEISRQVGYPNQLNFSRTFKNTFGISPQNWRKENRLIDINVNKKK